MHVYYRPFCLDILPPAVPLPRFRNVGLARMLLHCSMHGRVNAHYLPVFHHSTVRNSRCEMDQPHLWNVSLCRQFCELSSTVWTWHTIIMCIFKHRKLGDVLTTHLSSADHPARQAWLRYGIINTAACQHTNILIAVLVVATW